jgi:uncharacterized protein (DUF433 family)
MYRSRCRALKKRLRDWVAHGPKRVGDEFELSGALRVAWTLAAAQASERAAEYARLKERFIEINPDVMSGTPVIRGTRVPVRTLAQLVEGGESPEALREDYPHIPTEAYDLAVMWAAANPRRGRPVATGDSHGRGHRTTPGSTKRARARRAA